LQYERWPPSLSLPPLRPLLAPPSSPPPGLPSSPLPPSPPAAQAARAPRSTRRSRRIRSGGVVTAPALTFPGVADARASPADVNNARNAGFEAGLSNWTCSANSGTTVSSPVHGGTAALQATPAGQDNARCSQTVPVKPNSTYRLSGWVRGGYAYLGVTGT